MNDQLRLGYLHVGHIGPDIAEIFDQYRTDRARADDFGSWTDLRDYIARSYYPDFYHAEIIPFPRLVSAAPGQYVTFEVKVINASGRKLRESVDPRWYGSGPYGGEP